MAVAKCFPFLCRTWHVDDDDKNLNIISLSVRFDIDLCSFILKQLISYKRFCKNGLHSLISVKTFISAKTWHKGLDKMSASRYISRTSDVGIGKVLLDCLWSHMATLAKCFLPVYRTSYDDLDKMLPSMCKERHMMTLTKCFPFCVKNVLW